MSDLEPVWRYSSGGLTAEQEIRVEALGAAVTVACEMTGPGDDAGAMVLDLAGRFADWIGDGTTDDEEGGGGAVSQHHDDVR